MKMPDITPEELREPIGRPDIDVFHRLRTKLDAAADTIERLQTRNIELEQQVEALKRRCENLHQLLDHKNYE